MRPEKLVEELKEVAVALGVTVRIEVIKQNTIGQPKGGLCYVDGQPVVLVHRKLKDSDKAQVMIEALGEFDLDSVFIKPEVRETIEGVLPKLLKAG
jgi:hypothetical protein